MNRYLVSFLGVIGVGALLVAASCAGEETSTSASSGGGEGGSDATSGSGPTSTSASSGSGAGGAGQGGAGGAGQGGAGQGGAGGAGQGGAGGGGQSALVPSLTGMDFYINCMPIVGADPLLGSFTAGYDNSAGAGFAEAVITSAKLVLGDGKAWMFSVAPNKSGMISAGQTTMAAHTKTDGSGSGTISLCRYCNSTWTLDVTWDVGGEIVTDTLGPEMVQCVF